VVWHNASARLDASGGGFVSAAKLAAHLTVPFKRIVDFDVFLVLAEIGRDSGSYKHAAVFVLLRPADLFRCKKKKQRVL
jgi:hypothetical protein